MPAFVRWESNAARIDVQVNLPGEATTVDDVRRAFLKTVRGDELGVLAEHVKLGLAPGADPLPDDTLLAGLDIELGNGEPPLRPLYLLEELLVPKLTLHVRCCDSGHHILAEPVLPAREVHLVDVPLYGDTATICEAASQALCALDASADAVMRNPYWDSQLAFLRRNGDGEDRLMQVQVVLVQAVTFACEEFDISDALECANRHLAVAFFEAGPPIAAFSLPLVIWGPAAGAMEGERTQLIVRRDGKPWRRSDRVAGKDFRKLLPELAAVLRKEAGNPCLLRLEGPEGLAAPSSLSVARLAGLLDADADEAAAADAGSERGAGSAGGGGSAREAAASGGGYRLVAKVVPDTTIALDVRKINGCSGNMYDERVPLSTTVDWVRARMMQKNVWQRANVRLLYVTWMLDDGFTLSDYNIGGDCTIRSLLVPSPFF